MMYSAKSSHHEHDEWETAKTTGFGKLQLDIASHFTLTDVQALMTVLQFGRAEFDKVTRDSNPSIIFIKMLDAKDILTSKDISRLVSALEDAGLILIKSHVVQLYEDYKAGGLCVRLVGEVSEVVWLSGRLTTRGNQPLGAFQSLSLGRAVHHWGGKISTTVGSTKNRVARYQYRIR
ncbi:hypothetical protein BSL78_19100 [Apostichopus japonicus]|uniref:Uncharacterized protein n=1 Tax=Stichopus japonicus TaxID=307972 RepID=A0A2G8K7S7_STIJA|nr:hypothetical protein BSL78_19100 [Apostichopus japonicus]